MHARPEIDTEYMGDEFLQLVKACVDKAQKVSMMALVSGFGIPLTEYWNIMRFMIPKNLIMTTLMIGMGMLLI